MKLSHHLDFPKENNLDLLRLVFAVQVILQHAGQHLGSNIPTFFSYFPGVPAFFFVSGFLIYSSYQCSSPKRYFQNRCLRLFPALVLVTFGGLFVLLCAKGWGYLLDHFSLILFWFLGQITLLQAFNPTQFNDVGVGVINGALWTITTEIIFYLFIPVLVFCERKYQHSLLLFILISLVVYTMGNDLLKIPIYGDNTVYDFLSLTPVVWGWMFGLGILSVKYFYFIKKALPYLISSILPIGWMIHSNCQGIWFKCSGNNLGIFYFISYASLILWSAFFLPSFKIKSDLSYGLYIWHMPIINLLLIFNKPSLPVALACCLLSAMFSWFIVERNALKLKRSSLRYVQ